MNPRSFCLLNTEPGRLSSDAKSALNALVTVDEVEADRKFLIENIHKYDGLFIGLRNIFDRDILVRGKRLKCIISPTTGLNHIDLKCASDRNISIISLRGETEFLSTISATAELAWGLLLALVRKIPSAHQSVMSGEWERNNFYGNELRGRILGIIGFGRLGKMLKMYGQAFGMKILAYDSDPKFDKDVDFVELSDLLKRTDVISINLPLNDSTVGILGAKEFSQIKKGAFLINTSRGEILDEAALLQSLKTGHLAGAAIDVMASETSGNQNWLTESDLYIYARDHTNLLITPHIGGVTFESVEKTNRFVIEKFSKYLKGLP